MWGVRWGEYKETQVAVFTGTETYRSVGEAKLILLRNNEGIIPDSI